MTGIGDYAFESCTNLTAINVDALNPAYSSVDGVLFDKSGATIIQYPGGKTGSYTIPKSVAFIADCAFCDCTSLTGVTIPDSVMYIEDSAFSNCTSLASITIPSGVTSIGEYTFSYCSSLASVMIPSSVTTIGQWAFFYCPSLTTVKIPNSVTSIGADAFTDNSLTGVCFQGNAPSLGVSCCDDSPFSGGNPTIYYLPGTTGWGPTFAGRPTILWNPHLVIGHATSGVRTNQFGCSVTGTSNLVVVIETCTNLLNPAWSPFQTDTLASGPFYFSDPQWARYASRFYRVRMP